MKKLWLSFLILFLLSGALTGCGNSYSSQLSSFAPPEEKRLVIYTSHKEDVYGPIVEEFQARTGIWAEVVTGGTGELLDRIWKEKTSPQADVMFGGGVESLLAYASCFEPYLCSDVSRFKPGLVQGEGLYTPFSSLPFVLIYNTRLVTPGDLTGWADLLDSRWKGRIAFADPAISGSSYTAAVTMLSALPGDRWENLSSFYANLDSIVLEDSGDVTGKVASGSLSIGITLEQTALTAMAQGAGIGIVYPEEGTSILPDATALIAGAAHRENALAFLEFVQGTDVQELVVNRFSRRSVRTDVADRPDLPPIDTLTVIRYNIADASALKEEFLQRWESLRKEG